MEKIDWWYRYTVIAADGAVSKLLWQGIVPDIVVSDLDGPHEDLIRAGRERFDHFSACARR